MRIVSSSHDFPQGTKQVTHTLINADCLDYLNTSQRWTTLFADPPDNIGLGYQTYKDKLPDHQYVDLLETWLHLFIYRAKTVWFSFNAKWTFEVGRIVADVLRRTVGLAAKPCVQPFTFGQHCCQRAGKSSQVGGMKSSHFEQRGIRGRVTSTLSWLMETLHGESTQYGEDSGDRTATSLKVVRAEDRSGAWN